MKLLLIEDNESIILGLEYLLQEEGFRFDTARTAAEAERAVIRERYDLAFWISRCLTATVSGCGAKSAGSRSCR